MTIDKPTDQGSSEVGDQSSVSVPASDTGLCGFNAADGILLRAEHLWRLQEYARDFALVAGVAAGPGVDYGFNVTLQDNDSLHVTPGLAIDAARHPLRSMTAVTVPLGDLETGGANQFWIVEVAAGERQASGREAAYGTLCDDPCGGGAMQPWLCETVVVRVVSDSMPGLELACEELKQNALASLYFERERRSLDPWLTPSAAQQRISSILKREWDKGIPAMAPNPSSVPIAALLRIGECWVLDTWIARRDIGDAPARAGWEGHLGLRPWNIFQAQILQFQAQLMQDGEGRACVEKPDPRYADAVKKVSTRMADFPPTRGKAAAAFQVVVEAFRDLEEVSQNPCADTEYGASFDELPPSGILAVPYGITSDCVADYFSKRFHNPNVVVSVIVTRADCALRALEEAQHLDRIPLHGGCLPPHVQLHVPEIPADLRDLKPDDGYPWVVFTRGCECEQAMDEVTVLVVVSEDASSKMLGPVLTQGGTVDLNLKDLVEFLESLEGVDVDSFGVKYPAAEWAVPVPDDAFEAVQDALGQDSPRYNIFAFARTEDRQPLAFGRAALMSLEFDSDGSTHGRRISTFRWDDPHNEAIVVVIFPGTTSNGDSETPSGEVRDDGSDR